MKIYHLLIIAFAALLFIGCGGAATNNSVPTASASPTDVLKTYIEAADRKDLAAVKQTFSKGTMKMHEDAAQKKQTSVDQIIKEQFEAASSAGLKSKIQPGAETITGDTAIVEAKDSQTGNTERIPLVKEDGAWKLAFDKYLENIMERMREDMKMPAPPSGNSNKSAVNK